MASHRPEFGQNEKDNGIDDNQVGDSIKAQNARMVTAVKTTIKTPSISQLTIDCPSF